MFVIVYKLVARAMGLTLTQADLIVPATLFVALSPGVLLQLPDSTNLSTGKTSIQSVVTHALVFALVFALLRRQFPKYY